VSKKTIWIAVALVAVVAAGVAAYFLLPGLTQEMVTVRSGEIVLCTEGEVVSDTTTSLEVPADEVKDHGVTTRVITCELHAKLAALYATAQAAIAEGDLETAKSALAEIVELDPLYRRASSQLQEIEDGETPDADTGTTDNDPGEPVDPGEEPGTENPVGPIVNLTVYTPDTLPGFVGQGLIVDPLALTRDYLPSEPGPASKLVIVVEQFQSAESARAELEATIKPSYPDEPADVTVGDGGYYGANRSVAVVAFTDGALLVVVEIASSEGDASGLKSTVIDLAEEIAQ